MQPFRLLALIMVVVCWVGLITAPVLANKSSLQIEAPAMVKAGSTITIKLHVTHKGNNWFHYSDSRPHQPGVSCFSAAYRVALS